MALLLAALAARRSAASADDWPSRLGPTQRRRAAAAPGVFARARRIGLAKAWSQRFDGGRAGIAVADGRVVTLATQDERDVARRLGRRERARALARGPGRDPPGPVPRPRRHARARRRRARSSSRPAASSTRSTRPAAEGALDARPEGALRGEAPAGLLLVAPSATGGSSSRRRGSKRTRAWSRSTPRPATPRGRPAFAERAHYSSPIAGYRRRRGARSSCTRSSRDRRRWAA